MFLGIDFGTWSVKAVLVDGAQQVLGSAAVPLTVSRPLPGHNEQDPQEWWRALLDVLDALNAGCRDGRGRRAGRRALRAECGRAILAGKRSLADLAARVERENLEPKPRSGRQEYLENLVNCYL